jgi:hypothetical protein
MRMNSEAAEFASFVEICTAQKVALHPDIAAVAQEQLNDYGLIYPNYPTHTLYAIGKAAKVLQSDPSARLADRPVALLERPTSYPLSVLHRIINASFDPGAVQASGPRLPAAALGRMEVCPSAEEYMLETVRHVHAPTSHHSVQVFADETGPVLVRKGGAALGVPSAFSVQEVVAGGIPWPAFTLFRAEAVWDTFECKDHWRPLLHLGRTAVYPLSDITGVAPQRLTAFSLPARDRTEAFGWLIRNYMSESAAVFAYHQEAHILSERIAQVTASIQKRPKIAQAMRRWLRPRG